MRKCTTALGVVVLTLACSGCGSSSSGGGKSSGTTATAETYPSSFPVDGSVLPNGGNNGDSAVWYKVSGLTSGSSYQVAVAASSSKYTLNVQSSMSAVDDLCVASPAATAATAAQCSFKATAGTIYVGVANLDTQTITFTLSVVAQ